MLAPRLVAVLILAISLAAFGRASAAELVMFETAGCPFCARWHREIGPIYPKTEEAKRAPLRRVEITASRPPDLAAIEGIIYTPTFVLVRHGREIGRIVGYGGEEAFWSLLAELMERLDRDAPADRSGAPPPAPDTATPIETTDPGKNRSKSP